MALITKPNTFSAGETIVASEHNSNFDTVYNEFNGSISNANIDGSAAIVDTKLAQITTPSKVSGAAFTSLTSVPSGAGEIPAINLAALYPVGFIFISITSTNPGTALGFGTWVAFGEGKVLVSLDSGDSDFDVAEETGGAKTHTLTAGETAVLAGTVPSQDANQGGTAAFVQQGDGAGNKSTVATTVNSGGGGAHNNVQPYIVVFMFKRTV